jgi:LCP family protein required for cell wall assembly
MTPVGTIEAYLQLTPVPGMALYGACMLDDNCIPPPAPPVRTLQETENILLLCRDLREGWDNWRTDTIMLAVINHETDQVALISFPRDMYVYHPWYGKHRINVLDFMGVNHQYPGGGFAVMKEVFEYNFGIPVHHVLRVHRGAFIEFVDAIGGVDISLDCDLWELSPKPGGGYNVLYMPAGPHHLDGEKAIEYATFRYRTNDWGRARRQHAVLAAIKAQAAQLGIITKAPQLWGIIQRNVSGDLGFMDLLRYAKYGLALDMSSIHSHVFSNRELTGGKLSSGAYVLLPKSETALADVLEYIFEYVAISKQGTHPKGCPPPPAWAPDYLQSLTPTPPQ